MAKNMTRKGLAIGAAASLAVTGFAALPAQAAGLADKSFVSLNPTTGPSDEFTVIAGNGATFSLTANEATTVVGGSVKFLVSDPAGTIEPTSATTGRDFDIADSVDTAASDGSKVVTLTVANDLADGDLVSFSGDVEVATGTMIVDASDGPFEVLSASSTAFTIQGSAATTASTGAATLDDARTIEVLREARNTTTNTFVVDTGSASSTANEVLVLADADTTTRSVEVTAWVDANGNDVIDSTEYTSETRTVTFKKSTEITPSVALTAPQIGDANLEAKVSFSPSLNGAQVAAYDNDFLVVEFARQGSTGKNYQATTGTGEWSNTDKVFTLTQDHDANTDSVNSGSWSLTGTDWSGLSNNVGAGTYSAIAYLLSTSTKSATASATVGAAVSGNIVAETVPNNNVQADSSDTSAGNPADTIIRTGTTSFEVMTTVYDSTVTTDTVGAGVPVKATLSATSGTIKVNGNATSAVVNTDANGQVTFTVTSANALSTDAATLTIVAQGDTDAADQAKFDFVWDDAAYKMLDLNDNGIAYSGTDFLQRSINAGGSYTYNFAVVDQWGAPLPDGHRVRAAVTGRTDGTQFVTIVDGRANLTVGDEGLNSNTDGAISIEASVEQLDGTAETVTVDELNTAESGPLVIDVLDETNTVKLNDTDNDNSVASTTTDFGDSIAKAELKALDVRTSNEELASVSGDVIITGTVTNSVTADPREGAIVTVSGDSEFLFNVGTRYAYGTLTFVADASGQFAVKILSNKTATDAVITVSSNGATDTHKVSFTNAVTDGAALAVSAPAFAAPGSTYEVVATLTDKYGNPVEVKTTDTGVDVGVTYTGPGIVFGNLPTTTDKNGQMRFAVLLGANDSGTATVTVSYDGDNASTTNTNVATASNTVTVGTAPATQKVNAGSFKGFVAVYARGYEDQRLSAKIGNDWVIVDPIVNNQEEDDLFRVTDFTGAGVDIQVRIYIDRVLIDTIPLTTK